MIVKTLRSPWIFIIGLLAIAAVSFGLLASRLGFYWDDWTIVWYIHFLGPGIFKEAFAGDRPLLAWIYTITTTLVGENPLHWQIFAILTRWLACTVLWAAMRGLWPRKPVQTIAIAILFMIYPGFRQSFIAITYGNAFIVLAIYLASWALMIWSVRRPRWFWLLYVSSIALALYSVFTAEHFFGLELLRPVMLWIVLRDQATEKPSAKASLRRVGLLWATFALIDAAFLIWRIGHPTPRAQITFFDSIHAGLFDTIIVLIRTAAHDIYTASVLAWKQVISFLWLADYAQNVWLQYVFVVLACSVITGLLLWAASTHINSENLYSKRRKWAMQALGLGLFSMLVAGIPIWPTNLRIGLDFPWDRFTLPMMFGASLTLVGLIELLNFVRFQNILLVAVIAGLAAGIHYHNALSYREDWLTQRDYFWQLTWRAPGIQSGTILLTSEMPFDYDWDNSLTAPLNWTYAPNFEGRDLPYLMYNAESRLSSGLPDLEKNTQINESLRITPFNGSISQTILAFYRPPGACVNVIDPQRDKNLPDKPRYFKDIYTLSRLELILVDGNLEAKPPMQFFGPEPEHGWCYFFEKAELARQVEDWEKIVQLGNLAFQQNRGFSRKNASELLPFIEGYAYTKNWEKSFQLTQRAFEAWPNMRLSLCNLWGSIEASQSVDTEGRAIFDKVYQTLSCQELIP
jgi:hypothetical protein